jgi:hypothetical protein
MTKEIFEKNNPHPDIGKSKYKVKLGYYIWAEYEVVADSKDEAYDAVHEQGGIDRIKWQEGHHRNNEVQVIAEDWNPDTTESFEAEKIAECVPYEDSDSIDYSDPSWETEEYMWQKEEA